MPREHRTTPPPRRGRVANPPTRTTLIYDGDCGFCQSHVDRWQRRTGDAVEYVKSQTLGDRFAEVPRGLFGKGVVRVATTGDWSFGGEAVFGTLADGGRRWPLTLYRRVPLFAPLVERGYAWIARHRASLPHSGSGTCRIDRAP